MVYDLQIWDKWQLKMGFDGGIMGYNGIYHTHMLHLWHISLHLGDFLR